MDWLNYHHLLYFWTVAREGTVRAAAKRLLLAPSTVSAQLRTLEDALGQPLLRRSGRNVVLTDFGREIFAFADDIFAVGRELLDYARGHQSGRALRLHVGVTSMVPKLVAYELLAPALALDVPLHLVEHEGHPQRLLAELANHHLDVVIVDAPIGPDARIRAFNHPLGSTEIELFATPELVERYAEGFPESLDGAPMLLPTTEFSVRLQIDHWLQERDLHPVLVGEFQDSALLKTFGQHGHGIFPAPSVVAEGVRRLYGVVSLGVADGVVERFYAVSAERRLEHPGILAIQEAAHAWTGARVGT